MKICLHDNSYFI